MVSWAPGPRRVKEAVADVVAGRGVDDRPGLVFGGHLSPGTP